jgi:hypothetical protein
LRYLFLMRRESQTEALRDAVRIFSCSVEGANSSTRIRSTIFAADEQRARELALRELGDEPAASIEISENGKVVLAETTGRAGEAEA